MSSSDPYAERLERLARAVPRSALGASRSASWARAEWERRGGGAAARGTPRRRRVRGLRRDAHPHRLAARGRPSPRRRGGGGAAELVFLTVPDDAIAEVAGGLAAVDAWRPGQIVIALLGQARARGP